MSKKKVQDAPTETLFLGIGDAHFPWADTSVLNKVIANIKKLQPQYIIQIGDLYDFYCFSKYMRSLNLMTPEDEIKKGRAMAKSFWRRVRKAAPNAKCYQILGNHDLRMRLRVMEKIPAIESLMGGTDKLWKFEGVKTIMDPREELHLEGVCFTHGHLTKIGDHARKTGMPTVVGHSHRGGTATLTGRGESNIWELNLGWIGDQKAAVFNYRALKKANFWTTGYGVILRKNGILYPRFIEVK